MLVGDKQRFNRRNNRALDSKYSNKLEDKNAGSKCKHTLKIFQ